MEIKPMKSQDNGGADFSLVELADDGNIGRLTPHCKVHRAMNKVNKEVWRCLQDCRAGCVELSLTKEK